MRERSVLVTGGSRGIGAATCRLFAAEGWRVAFTWRADEAAAREVEAVTEGLAIQADVRDEAQVATAFERAGPLDAVVNNAGIVAPKSQLADMELDRMRRVVEVNVIGAMLVARAAARYLSTARGGRGGSLVNVSSRAAALGSGGEYVDYAATKGALDTLTIGLAVELGGEGVRVNAVRPGLIQTDIHASGGQPDRAARMGSATPMGRAGTAQEVAAGILWLCSDAASYVTGTLLDIGGGR